jgi:bifunctional enzyme CysN/CysC
LTNNAHMSPKSSDITKVQHRLTIEERWRLNGHRSAVIWLTGLSGSGKSTLAMELERALHAQGHRAYALDGDNLRHGLCSDLGFSPEDRAENIRRVGELAIILAEAGMVAITAFISPYRADRDRVREKAGALFHEVHLSADIETCAARDPKGLYEKAKKGLIPDFTGISAPYEAPLNPELTLDTGKLTIAESVARLVDHLIPANDF